MLDRKYAVLSLDVEDWYHLDYFDAGQCNRDYTMLDGLDRYCEVLARHGLPSTFFVLGELAARLGDRLAGLATAGHEVGCHGWDHTRPLTVPVAGFAEALERAKKTLEDATGNPVHSYRAPCFSLDRERLERVAALGFGVDSSRIRFNGHPLYGEIDMGGFEALSPQVYGRGGFFELEVSTLSIAGRHVPVSGGGYLRIFPWVLMRRLLQRYLAEQRLYILYIHPFELSAHANPPFPKATPWRTRQRFSVGRSGVVDKLERLIALLRREGFQFITGSGLRDQLLATMAPAPA